MFTNRRFRSTILAFIVPTAVAALGFATGILTRPTPTLSPDDARLLEEVHAAIQDGAVTIILDVTPSGNTQVSD